MEKFYTVNEGSKLYDDYWAWRNSIASNKKIVDDFFKEFGIEADLYCPNSTVIGILPTDNDRIKFAKQNSPFKFKYHLKKVILYIHLKFSTSLV